MTSPTPVPFNVLIVAQSGRLQYEALLFVASLRHSDPEFSGRVLVAVPQPGPLWSSEPQIKNAALLAALDRLGAEILAFDNKVFGESYPNGNKIEALLQAPPDVPFVFFDTDTLITGPLSRVPFDFNRPSASMRREGTWPTPTLYGPGYTQIWRSVYDRFGIEFDSTLDLNQPDEYWRRYLYFNAGWFFGPCPRRFGARFLEIAKEIRDDPPVELAGQSFDPWLDQIALPLVIHEAGGARRTLPDGLLDGSISCHYRLFPLLFARESDRVIEVLRGASAPNWIKKVLKQYEPIKKLVYQGHGDKARALFDRDHLPRREQAIRKQLRSAGLWMR